MTISRHILLLGMTLCGFMLIYQLWHAIAPGIVLDSRGLSITNGQDFLNYWAGPQIARDTIRALFSASEYDTALHHFYDKEITELRWSYPLHSLFFYAPLGLLPYNMALMAWTLLGISLYLMVVWFALPPSQRRTLTVWLFVSPVVLLEVITRQNGFFTAAGGLGALLLLERKRPVFAGILLGCLTIKPQLFILWPLLLLVERQWRCIVASCITTVLLIGASLMVHGVAAWQEFLATVPAFQWQLVSNPLIFEIRRLYQLMMPGAMVSLHILNAPQLLIVPLQILISTIVCVTAVMAFSRPLSLPQKALILACGGLLVSPYGFNYDMTFICAALLLTWSNYTRLPILECVSGGGVYLLPLMIYFLNTASIPLGPIFLLMLYVKTVRDVWRIPRSSVLTHQNHTHSE